MINRSTSSSLFRASMRLTASDVRIAHAETHLVPRKYKLSNTLFGAAAFFSPISATRRPTRSSPPAGVGVVGPIVRLNIVLRLREVDAQRSCWVRTRLAHLGKRLHLAFPRCKNDGANERKS